MTDPPAPTFEARLVQARDISVRLKRAIGRVIVDHDDFEAGRTAGIPVVLGPEVGDQRADHGTFVACRDDDAEVRHVPAEHRLRLDATRAF